MPLGIRLVSGPNRLALNVIAKVLLGFDCHVIGHYLALGMQGRLAVTSSLTELVIFTTLFVRPTYLVCRAVFGRRISPLVSSFVWGQAFYHRTSRRGVVYHFDLDLLQGGVANFFGSLWDSGSTSRVAH